MASGFYNSFKKELLDGDIDFGANTFKIMLVGSGYTPNFDTHDRRDDISSEVSGTGYTAGGATLGSVNVSQDNTDDEGVVDWADASWSTATITARGAIIYKSTGVAANDNLVCYIDFGSDYTSTAGTFLLQFAAEGVINLN